ncbi:uncharacterized protein LOC124148097 isoform X1 [Haliotis rufescens]|uniref:uncharacterized protein LOC124148097 isoform X1 n=1 Tax=Haliotis rufescens TaxID=6454 RepID=UPI00201EB65A|nr:uncharacterized protein LOC124148097 isoform X1 [Haliotis rufescens]
MLKMKMQTCLVVLWSILLFVRESDCQCDFPIQGNWYMSRSNEKLSFQGSSVLGFTFEGGPLLQIDLTTTYNCIATDGSRYVIQSSQGVAEAGGLQHAFTCLHFISGETTGNIATFVQATITGPATAPFLVKYITAAALSADYLTNVCDLATPYPEHRYHVFVREAVLGSVGVACPGELQGLLTVTSPPTACPASLTGCSSSTSLQKGDSTTCSCTGCSAPLYYATNPVRCLMNRTDTTNSRSYVTLINPELTQRFICIVVKESTSVSTVSFSQRPLQCDESQSSTTATGGEAFTFGKETCPPEPSDGTLSATALSIIGAVVAIIIIIIIITAIVIFIICKRRKKREEEKKRLERRAMRREERRRRRLERQDRIRRGLPVSDLDSDSDSCYSTQSNTTLEETDDKPIFKRKKRPSTPKKLGKKFRKIYDEKGNLIREEEIPPDSDDSGDETIYTVTEDGRQVKKRRAKKTRKYIKERKLPNGKKVKELVESDYWSTCSEESIESWEVDPVRAEIHLARLRRKKERDDMMLELAQPRQGPMVTRLMYEKKTGRDEHRGSKKPGNFKRLARRKQKKVQEPREEEEEEEEGNDVDGPERDQYMAQYMKKKRLDGVLEDEGFWDEERAKQTAREIFEFERLDAEIEGKTAYPDIEFVSETPGDEQQSSAMETSTQEVTVEDETEKKNSINRLKDKVRQKGKDEASVKFKDDGISKSEYDDQHDDDKTRKQVTARVSQLLTQRLLGEDHTQDKKSALKLSESRKKGRVIFVEEMKQRQAPGTQPNRPGALAPIKKVVGKGSLPGQRRPITMDPEQAAIYREGLAKDKHIVDALTAEDSRELESDNEDGDSDLDEGHSRLSPLNRRKGRGQQIGHFPRVQGHAREAWGHGGSSTTADNNGKPTVPYTVSAPKFHSYLNFLRGHGSADRPGHLTDRDASYCRGIRAPKGMTMDDARLRRLLEELYRDKKYMDTIIDAEESNDEEKVKHLAAQGRDYLLQMALFWEEKGPLPPRPSVTSLGFKLERSKSAFIKDETETQRPTIARHKTVC